MIFLLFLNYNNDKLKNFFFNFSKSEEEANQLSNDLSQFLQINLYLIISKYLIITLIKFNMS